eukprot:6177362-Pleurochrysis_carterae.AAC.1
MRARARACVPLCVRACVYRCVCVCVCARAHLSACAAPSNHLGPDAVAARARSKGGHRGKRARVKMQIRSAREDSSAFPRPSFQRIMSA